MRALLFGSKGFVSSYLRDYLLSKDYVVQGFDLRDGCDIRDYETVRNAIDTFRPDCIFVLAAQAAPAESFNNPGRTFAVNTIGPTNVLEAVRQLGVKPEIMLCGTSEEYGPFSSTEAISSFSPRSPYAISKVAMDYMGQLYSKAYGMHIVVTRAFNHTGPGRGEMYMEASMARQVAQIEAGQRDFIEHGNLASIRNFTDVRDIVRAYELAIHLPSGVYNICSGNNYSVRQVIDILCDLADIHPKLVVNQSLVRPADFSFEKPNCTLFRNATGWKPRYSFRMTLQDILDEWRERI